MGTVDDLRTDLFLGFHILDDAGLDSGIAGHLTARHTDGSGLWGHPWGMGFAEVAEDDLVQVDDRLAVVSGPGPVTPSLAFHVAIYQARPDVGAIVHTHSPRAIALGIAGAMLEPVFQSALIFHDDVTILAEFDGIIEDDVTGSALARALGSKRALMLRNHGLVVVGRDVREAVTGAILFEQAAAIQLDAMATGRPLYTVPDDAARATKAFLLSEPILAMRWAYLARRAALSRPFLTPARDRVQPARPPASGR